MSKPGVNLTTPSAGMQNYTFSNLMVYIKTSRHGGLPEVTLFDIAVIGGDSRLVCIWRMH